MLLIYLHGAPAVGKLTIAHALAGLTGARLFHNHVMIDAARSVFDFGADGFWPLVNQLRQTAIRAAANGGVPILITTSCFADPEDLPELEKLEAALRSAESQFAPVYLTCPIDELEARVIRADRREMRKISSVSGLHDFLSRYNIAPVPRPDVLTIDTAELSPEDAARQIVTRLNLPLIQSEI